MTVDPVPEHLTAAWQQALTSPQARAQQERWAPIPGYEGLYEVSDLGRVRSLDRIISTPRWTRLRPGRVLKPKTKSNRVHYHLVQLFRDSQCRNRMVHHLVLEAFIGPRPDGMFACHNDGDPQNNVLSNLRWDTPSSNSQDTVRHGKHRGATKTHCPSGHPYSGENLIYHRNGGILRRRCRTCVVAHKQKQLVRRRAAKRAGAAA